MLSFPQNIIQKDLQDNFDDWSFNTVFKRKGVQAICGLMNKKSKSDMPPIVYKVGAFPERSLEHEEVIMNACNNLRSFSPHFVYLYHSKIINVCNKFIEHNVKHTCSCENCKNDRLKNNNKFNILSSSQNIKDYKERKILFMEYVSNIHLKHALRANDDYLATCLLVMCMAAIHQGIESKGLCHYDLHIDNILIKECDPHSYFAYRFKNGKTILTPTRGYYPIFIDFGTGYTHSYIKSENNYNCKTSVINTHNGLQPTVFDKFVDAHQLITSSLYELESISDRYYNISTLFYKEFISVPIFHETGWKRLPFDIYTIFLNKIEDYDPKIETDYPIWNDQQSEFIEILSLSITLPFKTIADSELINCCKKYNIQYDFKNTTKSFDQLFGYLFKNICIQVTNIQRSLNLIKNEENCITNEDEIYYIIREIIESKTEQEAANIHSKYKMGKKCDTKKCWKLIKDLAPLLSSFYTQYFKTHESVIQDMYKNVPFEDSVDIAYFLQKNTFCNPTYLGEVDVYCFDSITQTSTVKKLNTQLLHPTLSSLQQNANLLFN